jgi:hypothetical protein
MGERNDAGGPLRDGYVKCSFTSSRAEIFELRLGEGLPVFE